MDYNPILLYSRVTTGTGSATVNNLFVLSAGTTASRRMHERYVVLGDVVQSREIAARERFRRMLADACEDVNREYRTDIVAPFELLKGVDELGGVLSSVTGIYDIVKDLFDALHPHRLRIAVVRGEIDVGADTGVVSQMDGPAFHRADELLEQVERADLLFDARIGQERFDLAVADEINLLLATRRRWTDRQREIIDYYERYGSQYDVAEELGITQQAVSKSLGKASWQMVQRIEERLGRVLQEYES